RSPAGLPVRFWTLRQTVRLRADAVCCVRRLDPRIVGLPDISDRPRGPRGIARVGVFPGRDGGPSAWLLRPARRTGDVLGYGGGPDAAEPRSPLKIRPVLRDDARPVCGHKRRYGGLARYSGTDAVLDRPAPVWLRLRLGPWRPDGVRPGHRPDLADVP